MARDSAPAPECPGSPLKAQPPVIAVMGLTGAGKSTFIDLICGSNSERPKVGHDVESCTDDVEAYPCVLRDGRKVVLLDTPGFGDTLREDDEIMCQIVEFVAEATKQGMEIAGIIYLHNICDVRMTASGAASLDMLHDLCGVDAARNVAFVTNRWEQLPDRSTGERRLQDLRDRYWKDLMDAGSKHWAHQNNGDSVDTILASLADLAADPIGFPDFGTESSASGWAMVRKLDRKLKATEARKARLEEKSRLKPGSRSLPLSLDSCNMIISDVGKRKQELEKYGAKIEWKYTLREVGKVTAVLVSVATLGIGSAPAIAGYFVYRAALNIWAPENADRFGHARHWIRQSEAKGVGGSGQT